MSRSVKLSRLGTLEKLQARLDALDCTLPVEGEIEPEGPLGAAFALGGRRVGNRFAVLPMEGWDGTGEGRPTELVRRRWRNFGASKNPDGSYRNDGVDQIRRALDMIRDNPYSRRILVSGTTATDPHGNCVCPGDPAGQATFILDKIAAALDALGASPEDVVRTRIYLRDKTAWQAVSQAHHRMFSEIRPANTLIEISGLVGAYEVEIEAEAEHPD